MQPESEPIASRSELRWQLRLFATADLCGSSSYKVTRSGEITATWAPTFKEFFSQFPELLKKQYDEAPDKLTQCQERLAPWKFLGDEALFSTEIKEYSEVATHLWAFKSVVRKLPDIWKKKDKLPLKSTAWLAGFPIKNTELELQSSGTRIVDYIGPSIDLGFRLTRYSDPRRFVLSADLAVMLIDALHKLELEDTTSKDFLLILQGRESLRGVLGGTPYPIVWLDMHNGEPSLEEKLLSISYLPQHTELRRYLTDCINQTDGLHRPFIANDPDSRYGNIPPEFAKAFESLLHQRQSEETERGYGSKEEQDAAEVQSTAQEALDEPMIATTTGNPDESKGSAGN